MCFAQTFSFVARARRAAAARAPDASRWRRGASAAAWDAAAPWGVAAIAPHGATFSIEVRLRIDAHTAGRVATMSQSYQSIEDGATKTTAAAEEASKSRLPFVLLAFGVAVVVAIGVASRAEIMNEARPCTSERAGLDAGSRHHRDAARHIRDSVHGERRRPGPKHL